MSAELTKVLEKMEDFSPGKSDEFDAGFDAGFDAEFEAVKSHPS